MSSSAAQAITSGLAKLNPFGKVRDDDENKGEAIQADSVGGGGHASRKSKITKDQLRVSHALKSFLAHHEVLSEHDAGLHSDELTTAMKTLLDKPHIHVPSSVTDRSYPLSEYFISSSHNTYLLAHQLYGSSSPVAYETALNTGARCVEVDAWDDEKDKEEPKVTHGLTLASHISFRSVCETMRNFVDKETAAQPMAEFAYRTGPIFLSLENHCSAHGQLRLVQIMHEVWGDRMISKHVQDEAASNSSGSENEVTLARLGSKIAVIVEYHFPNQAQHEEEADGESEDEDEEAKRDRRAYEQRKKEAPKEGIIPELAELGVYAQSVKPRDHSWVEGELKDAPHHHLMNVSESGLSSLMPKANHGIGKHNSKHMMRVYPKGTRISSQNLNPVLFWGVGAQICALNWQTFDASMQLNEALFSGTDGYVLKPAALRSNGPSSGSGGTKRKLRLMIAGATDVPLPKGREADEIRPYVTCTLVHPNDTENNPPKRKTAAYKQHKLGILFRGENPPPSDPVWDETLEWDFEDNELTFLRILIKSDDKFARNPVFAVAAVRLLYVTEGWSFVRMLDLTGRETRCALLVNFKLESA